MDKLDVGDEIEGFCNGYFGRDSYGRKRVIAKGNERGHNWLVVWNEWDGRLEFAEGFSNEDVDNWLTEMADEKAWEGHDAGR